MKQVWQLCAATGILWPWQQTQCTGTGRGAGRGSGGGQTARGNSKQERPQQLHHAHGQHGHDEQRRLELLHFWDSAANSLCIDVLRSRRAGEGCGLAAAAAAGSVLWLAAFYKPCGRQDSSSGSGDVSISWSTFTIIVGNRDANGAHKACYDCHQSPLQALRQFIRHTNRQFSHWFTPPVSQSAMPTDPRCGRVMKHNLIVTTYNQ